jgi:hypothetical protein
MINRPRINPPHRFPFAPSPPYRLLRFIRLVRLIPILLLHFILAFHPQQIPPAPILIRQQIRPGRLIRMQTLRQDPLVPLARRVASTTRSAVCPCSVIVGDQFVDGVGRGEGERSEAKGLTEEETEAWWAVDVEFGLRGSSVRSKCTK